MAFPAATAWSECTEPRPEGYPGYGQFASVVVCRRECQQLRDPSDPASPFFLPPSDRVDTWTCNQWCAFAVNEVRPSGRPSYKNATRAWKGVRGCD